MNDRAGLEIRQIEGSIAPSFWTSSVCSAVKTSTMSSMVMTPRISPFSSITGMTLRSYFAILRATSSCPDRRHAQDVRAEDHVERLDREARQIANRGDADELVPRVQRVTLWTFSLCSCVYARTASIAERTVISRFTAT